MTTSEWSEGSLEREETPEELGLAEERSLADALTSALSDQLDRVIAAVWASAEEGGEGAGELPARALVERLRALYPGAERPTSGRSLGSDLVIDAHAREVWSAGRRVQLTRREFEVLCFLVQHHDRVLTRDELLTRVWRGGAGASPRTVDIHIHRLRHKLGRPFVERIQTLRNVGYKLAAEPLPFRGRSVVDEPVVAAVVAVTSREGEHVPESPRFAIASGGSPR